MILPVLAAAPAGHLHFTDLGLNPVIVSVGSFDLRWYSLAYIVGILVGWWYLLRLIAQPGAPLGKREADDIVFYVTLGIILGGRLGYVLFYGWYMFAHPLEIFRLWDGGMSFHGGVIGVCLALLIFTRRHGLSWMRVADYISCCLPFGLFFGRLANFVNGELWGRPSDVAWAIVPAGSIVPRHPSQLYEAMLEGIVVFLILAWAFWRTRARWEPGKLGGLFLFCYGWARFAVEFFREPDAQFADTVFARWGFHMGQFLCVPMILIGWWLIATAKRRMARSTPPVGSPRAA